MPGIFRLYQRRVKEQLGKDTHVAAKIKTSLQRGGVPRVLGTGLASLAGVGLAGLYSVQRKSAQSPSTSVAGSKEATRHCRLLEAICCSVVWLSGVFPYASSLARAERRRKRSLLAEWVRYLPWVTFSCFPDFTLMLLCSSSAADN